MTQPFSALSVMLTRVPHVGRDRHQRQRGALVLMTAIFLALAVILLASIDIGYLFYKKRELQKTADMAALSGAQQIGKMVAGNTCAQAFAVATGNAVQSNKFSGTTVTHCGRWDPLVYTTAPYYSVYAGGVTPTGQPMPNAISVTLTQSYRSFFGIWVTRQVNASSIAKVAVSAPNAVFSVGSRLLQVNGGVVPGLLTILGANINASAVGYSGLVNVGISSSGLLAALGFQIPLTADVGTIKSIIQAGTPACNAGVCPLSTLLGAITTVGGQSNLVNLLGIQAGQLLLPVKLLTDASGRGLFTLLDAANGQAALTASINALELITAGIGVANSHRFADVITPVNIPGLLNSDLRIGLVEPPSIGIGGIGTTAYTSQVRVYADINSNLLNAGLLAVNIPMVIDVVDGFGTITDMCTVKSGTNDTATIAVQAPILKLCAGAINASSIFSTAATCTTGLTPTPMVNLLNGALTVNTSLTAAALPNNGSVTLIKGQTATIGSNTLALGTTLSNLMNGVLANLISALFNQSKASGNGGVTNTTLAAQLLNSVSAVGGALNNAVGQVNTAASVLQTFVTSVINNASLTNSLGTLVTGVLSSVGNLVGGLLTSIVNLLGNLLGNVACALSGNYNQCVLSNELGGSQTKNGTTVSNLLLTLLGMVVNLLQPILNAVGAALATQLSTLLGLQLGLVDVSLIDLNCNSGTTVSLAY